MNAPDTANKKPAPPPRRRWLRILLWSLLGLLLVLVVALGWLIGSPSGTRFALDQAARALPALQMDYRGGTLWRGLQLTRLSWRDGDTVAEIEQLETRWDFTCLPAALCIQRIAAAEIRVQLPAADPDAPVDPPREGAIELPQLSLPIGLELGELSLPKVSIRIGDAAHQISDIRLALSAAEQQLQLVELAAQYQDNRVSASGTLGLTDDFPLALRVIAEAPSVLPAPQRIELDLGGNLSRTELVARLSGAFELSLSGQIQALEPTLPLDLRADWQALHWPPSGEPQVSVAAGKLTARGDLNGIDTRLDTTLTAANQPPVAVSLDARANPAKTDLRSLQLELLGGTLTLRGVAEYADAVRWDIRGDFAELDPGQIAPGASGQLAGELATRGGLDNGDWYLEHAGLRVDGELKQLPLALNIDVQRPAGEPLALQQLRLEALEGQLELRGDVALAPELGWDLHGEFSGINPAGLAPDLPGELNGSLAVRGGLADDWQLALARFDLDGVLRELPLKLALRAQRPAGEPLALQQLQLDVLDGQLNIAGSVALTPQIGWDMAGDFAAINPGKLNPELPGALGGNFSLRGGLTEDGDWQLALAKAQLDGQLRDYPLRLDAQLSRQPGDLWEIAKLQLDSGSNRIRAAGKLDQQWALSGDIDLPALDQLLPDLDGELQARFDLSGARLSPSVQLQASGQDLAAAGAALESLSLQAEIDRLFEGDSRVTLQAKNLRQGEQSFGDLDLALSGTRAAHQLELALAGGQLKDRELAVVTALHGALKLLEGGGVDWRGSLDSARLAAVGQDWSLAAPTALSWSDSDKAAQIAAHCWQQAEARLCLREEATAGASGAASLRLSDLPLASLSALLPPNTELQGELGADIAARWAPETSPVLDLELAVDGGGVRLRDAQNGAEPLDFVYRQLRLSAQMDQQRIDANIALDSDALGEARVALRLNPQIAGYPLDGTVRLAGLDIAVARAFVPQLEQLAGLIEVDGRLSGTLSQPDFAGRVSLAELKVAGEQLPLQITGGGIDAELAGPRADFSGRIETDGGAIDISGDAHWDTPEWGLAANISGQRLQIAQKPTIEATLSPDIQLSLSPTLFKLRGKVEIPRARVTVRELPESATSLSDDAVVIREESAAEPPPPKLRKDIQLLVILGDDVRLEGFDLRAGLSGDVQLRQQGAEPPQLDGEINITEGIYKAYGQDLTIRSGRVLLLGPVQSTAVDVEAIRTTGEQVAGLRASGNILNPTIELFAEPSQTQEDTLSWILLGRPLYGATSSPPDEAGMLAKAAVALGIKGGRGIATGIAEAFGIQDFEIDTATEGDDTQVVVSGRLSPKLYLRYGVGVLTPVNTVTLRYNLTEKFYVETAQGVESALDFFYSFDF